MRQKRFLSSANPFHSIWGLVGVAGLVYLAASTLVSLSYLPARNVPVQAIQITWLILYSVMGGVNGALGQLGFVLFRCTNRYSIYILAIILLYTVRELSRLTRRWNTPMVAIGAIFLIWLIIWDQTPPSLTQDSIDRVKQRLASDRAFTNALEQRFPPKAMVFQMPAVRFPEFGPTGQMADYEHFRPYLFSKKLHFLMETIRAAEGRIGSFKRSGCLRTNWCALSKTMVSPPFT